MEAEDLRIEQAEDREWENIKDTVERGREDFDGEDRDGNGVSDRYEHGKFDVSDPETRDELRMEFVDEE